MNYNFSDRVQNLKPSAIREIFKYATDPSVISLSAGNPSPEAFPAHELAEISNRILTDMPISVLQYGITEGYAPLRDTLKEYMKTKGIGKNFDELIITSGAQQVMDLTVKSLCNEGDTIICEAPSFIGSLNTFRSYLCNLKGIPIEQDGMNINALETALKTDKKVRFIYTIPTFQNPSGVTTSLEKRKAIYALAKKYNVLILEDNPYGELRYKGQDVATIKSMDTDGIVLYAGSFSKIIAPGIRVGWCVAPSAIIQKMVVCKQGEDVHTNVWSQILANEFMTKYDFQSHLQFLRDLYSKKAKLMEDLLDEYLAPLVSYNKIDGGLFTLCALPDSVDMLDFCKQAVLKKVCVVPGNAFLTDESEICHQFRINFTTPTDEQLKTGIKILGNLAKEIIK